MDWFNVFGLVFIAVIMIPNIIFAIKNKEGFENKRKNRFLEVAEQIGRIGCFVFMIINIPGVFGSSTRFVRVLLFHHVIFWGLQEFGVMAY